MPWLRPELGKSLGKAEKEGALSSFEATHPPIARFQSQVSGAAETPRESCSSSAEQSSQELRTVELPTGRIWSSCRASSSPLSSLGTVLVWASGASVSP